MKCVECDAEAVVIYTGSSFCEEHYEKHKKKVAPLVKHLEDFDKAIKDSEKTMDKIKKKRRFRRYE